MKTKRIEDLTMEKKLSNLFLLVIVKNAVLKKSHTSNMNSS